MRGLLLYMFYCVLRQILAFGRTIRLFGGFAVVLLLAISAEGDVAGEQNAAAGLVGAELSAIDNKPQLSGFSYSDWLQHKYYYGDIYNTDDITISGSGSFWGDVASQFSVDFDNATSRRVQDLLPGADDIRDIVIGDGGKLYFDDWRNDYRAQWRALPAELFGDAERAFTESLGDSAERRLGFVRRARVELQTSLGGRKAQGALDTTGALHETTETLLGWQLRGFAAAAGDKGGNAGLFYRFLSDENLLGVNAFADYYDERDVGGFWRWSAGGEYTSRWSSFSANYYQGISGERYLPDNFVAYTRGGWDAEVVLRAPAKAGVYAHIGYYRWRGQYGDNDEKGYRYGLRYAPGDDFEIKVEYDANVKRWGGGVLYSRTIGTPTESHRKLSFDPRAHFFDAVRREYGQRIGKIKIAGNAKAQMIIEQSGALLALRAANESFAATIRPGPPWRVVQRISANAEATTLTFGDALINYPAPLDEDITISIGGNNAQAIIRQRENNWRLTLHSKTEAAFLQTASLIVANSGMGVLWRMPNGAPFVMIVSARITMTLGAVHLAWDFSRTAPTTRITLYEGVLTLGSGGFSYSILVLNNARAVVDNIDTVACDALLSLPNVRAYCGGQPISRAAALIPAYKALAVATISVPPPDVFAEERLLVSLVSPVGIFDLRGFSALEYALSLTITTLADTAITADIRLQARGFAPLQVRVPVSIAPPLRLSASLFAITTGISATAAIVGGSGGLPPYRYLLEPPSSAWTLTAGSVILFDGGDAAGESLLTLLLDDDIGSRQATTAFAINIINPPPLTLLANDIVSPLLVNVGGAAAVLSASGGAGDYVYSLVGDGNVDNLTLALDNATATLYAESEGIITLTASVDDNHSQTQPATLELTITLTSGLLMRQVGDNLLITARADRGGDIAIATVVVDGGGDSYNYSLADNTPSYLGINSLGGGISAEVIIDNEMPTSDLIVILTAQVQSPNAPGGRDSASVQLTITIINPPLDISQRRLLSTMKLSVLDSALSISLFGGSQTGYSLSVIGSSGVSITAGFADNELRIFGISAGIATITMMAFDDSGNTATDTFSIVFAETLDINKATEFAADAPRTITTQIGDAVASGEFVAIGGVAPYTLSLAFGSDNRLELESGSLYYNPRSAPDNPFTIILTIVASDSLAGIHRGSASVVITLAAINPPEVMVDIKPIAAILLTGTNAAATISISGGYLPAGGDYAITITSNVASGNDIGISITGDDITLLAITANNPQTITATIIADDNHNNVIPATGYATLTVQALPVIGLTASRLLWTITTEVSITALAAVVGLSDSNLQIAEFGTAILAAGAHPFSMSFGGGLFGIFQDGAPSNTDLISFAISVRDALRRDTNQQWLALTLTAKVINPPPLTLLANDIVSPLLINVGGAAAVLSASGGAGDYVYSLVGDGNVDNLTLALDNATATLYATSEGVITLTASVDDNHSATSPATLELTITITSGLLMRQVGDNLLITARADRGGDIPIATVVVDGGGDSYNYSLADNTPSYLTINSLGGGISAEVIIDNEMPTSDAIVILTAQVQSPNAPGGRDNASVQLTITIINPPLDISQRRLLSTMKLSVLDSALSISLFGGSQTGYSLSVIGSSGVSITAGFADNELRIFGISAGIATITMMAFDDSGNTATDTFSIVFAETLDINKATEFAADAPRTITTQIGDAVASGEFVAIGGVAPYTLSLAFGSDNRLELESGSLYYNPRSAPDNPFTIILTIVASDSLAGIHRGSASVVITLAAINPPEVMVDIKPIAAILLTGTNAAATISISGGYLPAGGDYAITITSNVASGNDIGISITGDDITLLAITANNPQTITATIIADDNHNNVIPATGYATLTVQALPVIGLTASRLLWTITTEVSITALAAQAGINNGEIAEFGTLILAAGAHPFSMSFGGGLFGIFQDGAPSNTDLISFAISVRDALRRDTNQQWLALTLTAKVINPPPLTLLANDIVSPLLINVGGAAAVLSASGGAGDYVYSLVGDGNVDNLTLALDNATATLYAESEGIITLTASVDDNHSATSPATLELTITITSGLLMRQVGDNLLITARADRGGDIPIATVVVDGGGDSYNYSLADNTPSYLGINSLGGGISAEVILSNEMPTSDLIVILTAQVQSPNAPGGRDNASVQLTITIINPPLDISQRRLLSTMKLSVLDSALSISLFGGSQTGYSLSVIGSSGVSITAGFADNELRIFGISAGIATITMMAFDDSGNTATDTFSIVFAETLDINKATEFAADAPRTITTQIGDAVASGEFVAIGGVAPYTLSLAFGSDNRLELESGSLYYNPRSAPDNPFTIILTIVASDSLAGIHRGSASAVITLAAINPPEVMVDIKPIAAILLTGTNAAATISISGGYLPAGGDYAITITSNVASGNDIGISITGDDITLLAITANNPQTITATIIADDNHNNVMQATGYATLTVQALPVIGLTASRLLWTITTEVSITALAAQAGINNGEIAEFGTAILAAGEHPFDMSFGADNMLFSILQDGAPSNTGLISFAISVRDALRRDTNQEWLALTLTAKVINPPPLTLLANDIVSPLLVNVGGAAAVLSASGGAGDYVYSLVGDGNVDNLTLALDNATATLYAESEGIIILTASVDDNHSQTQPATLELTITITSGLLMRQVGDNLLITARADRGGDIPIATVVVDGGGDSYNYSLADNTPSYLGINSLGGGISAEVIIDNEMPTSDAIVILTAQVQSPNAPGGRDNASVQLTITIINPPLDISQRRLLSTMKLSVLDSALSISLFGGSQTGYSLTVIGSSGVSITAGFADNELRIFGISAGIATITMMAFDDSGNTATDTFSIVFAETLDINKATEFAADRPRTITTQIGDAVASGEFVAIGGVAPYTLSLAFGSDNRLELESGSLYYNPRSAPDNPFTIILTIVASDSLAGIHRGSASAVITLAAINPPEVMVDIKPIAAILLTGTNAAATISISGGYLPAGGDYAITITSNVASGNDIGISITGDDITLLAITANNPQTITATIIADDNHNNVIPATGYATLTVQALPVIGLTASRLLWTITTEVSITALAAQAGINNGEIAEFGTAILAAGEHPFDMSFGADNMLFSILQDGAPSNTGLISFAISVRDALRRDTNQEWLALTLTAKVINPPPLTLLANDIVSPLLVNVGGAAAVLSASGGAGDYVYSLVGDGNVDNLTLALDNATATLYAESEGIIILTASVDDNHSATSPATLELTITITSGLLMRQVGDNLLITARADRGGDIPIATVVVDGGGDSYNYSLADNTPSYLGINSLGGGISAEVIIDNEMPTSDLIVILTAQVQSPNAPGGRDNASVQLTITIINPPLDISQRRLLSTMKLSVLDSALSISLFGGSQTGYSLSVIGSSGVSITAGFADNELRIFGISAGIATITMMAFDDSGNTATDTFSIVFAETLDINKATEFAADAPRTITTQIGDAVASGEFVAIGGVAPYTLSLALGSDNRLELESGSLYYNPRSAPDNPFTIILTIVASDSLAGIHRGSASVVITLAAINPPEVMVDIKPIAAILLTGTNAAATISISGGYLPAGGDYAITITSNVASGNDIGISITGDDITLLAITANNPQTITATIIADDNHNNVIPATGYATLTVQALPVIGLTASQLLWTITTEVSITALAAVVGLSDSNIQIAEFGTLILAAGEHPFSMSFGGGLFGIFQDGAPSNTGLISFAISVRDALRRDTNQQWLALTLTAKVINPPPLTLLANDIVSPLLVNVGGAAAVLSASGGAGDYVYSLVGDGNVDNLTLALDNATATLYAESEGIITLTASVDDNHSATSPATLELTITLTSGLLMRQVGDNLLITARADRGGDIAIATVVVDGGGDSYNYSLADNTPSYLGINSLGGGISAEVILSNEMPTSDAIVILTAQVQSPNAPGGRDNASVQLTITIINPPLDISQRRLLSTMKLSVLDSALSISLFGGSQTGYSLSVIGSSGVSITAGFADNELRIFGISAGIATITMMAFDDSGNTATDTFSIVFAETLDINKATEFAADAPRTITTQIGDAVASGEFVAIGGVAPYTLSLALGSDNRLELESGSLYYNPRSAPDNPFTIILTIVASDSLAGIHRGSASVVITLAAINPPEVMVDIKPIAAILLTGTNAAATISISGGYLPAGGDYAITITSNVASGNDIGISITGDDITLLAITANNPQTITATIIADDNHNNVIPATGYATLTVQALPVIGLTASRLLWTITTEVSITALAAVVGLSDSNIQIAEFGTAILAAGAHPFSMSFGGGLFGIFQDGAPSNTGLISFAISVRDALRRDTNQEWLALTLTAKVINPPPLTLLANDIVSPLLVNVGGAAAVLSASGGAGDYVYSLVGDGNVDNLTLALDNATATLYAESEGIITLTASVDDNHSATSPATLELTITITSGLLMRQVGDNLLITARADRGGDIPIATVVVDGGGDSYNYSLADNTPSYLGINSLGGGISAEVIIDNEMPTSDLIVILTAQVQSPNAPGGRDNASVQLTITIINPPLDISQRRLLSTMKLSVLDSALSISLFGGSQTGYSLSVIGSSGVSITAGFADNELRIFGISAGIATITMMAFDDSGNTATDTFSIVFAETLDINKATEFAADAPRTITTQIGDAMASGEFVAIGGVAPYTLSLALGSDNRLELESGSLYYNPRSAPENPFTIILTIVASDSLAGIHRGSASVVITLAAINPPEVMVDIKPIAAILLTGTNAAATISISGGYLPAGGDYAITITSNVASGNDIGISITGDDITLLAITANNPQTITATIIADDNHNNVIPATGYATLTVIERLVLRADRVLATITAHLAGTITLATLRAAGGLLGYNYSITSDVGGVSLEGSVIVAPLSIGVLVDTLTSVLTATAFVADNSNLAVSVASLAITLSVQVIVQPPVVASYRGYVDIAENYRGIIGTVSASGGYRSGGGDITYIYDVDSSPPDIFVADGDGAISYSGGGNGVIVATLIADDTNEPSTPAASLTIDITIGELRGLGGNVVYARTLNALPGGIMSISAAVRQGGMSVIGTLSVFGESPANSDITYHLLSVYTPIFGGNSPATTMSMSVWLSEDGAITVSSVFGGNDNPYIGGVMAFAAEANDENPANTSPATIVGSIVIVPQLISITGSLPPTEIFAGESRLRFFVGRVVSLQNVIPTPFTDIRNLRASVFAPLSIFTSVLPNGFLPIALNASRELGEDYAITLSGYVEDIFDISRTDIFYTISVLARVVKIEVGKQLLTPTINVVGSGDMIVIRSRRADVGFQGWLLPDIAQYNLQYDGREGITTDGAYNANEITIRLNNRAPQNINDIPLLLTLTVLGGTPLFQDLVVPLQFIPPPFRFETITDNTRTATASIVAPSYLIGMSESPVFASVITSPPLTASVYSQGSGEQARHFYQFTLAAQEDKGFDYPITTQFRLSATSDIFIAYSDYQYTTEIRSQSLTLFASEQDITLTLGDLRGFNLAQGEVYFAVIPERNINNVKYLGFPASPEHIGWLTSRNQLHIGQLATNNFFESTALFLTITAVDGRTPPSPLGTAVITSTIRYYPPPLTLVANNVVSNWIVSTGVDVAILSASGGSGEYSYGLTGNGNVEGLLYGLDNTTATLYAESEGTITLTASVDDNNGDRSPATLELTIAITGSYNLQLMLGHQNPNIPQQRVMFTLGDLFAEDVRNYFNLVGINFFGSVSVAFSDNIPAHITLEGPNLNPAGNLVGFQINQLPYRNFFGNTLYAIQMTVWDTRRSPLGTAVISLTVRYRLPPLGMNITLSRSGALLTGGTGIPVATVSAFGGHLDEGSAYRYSSFFGFADAAVSVFADGAVSVSSANVGLILITILADDDSAETPPATLIMTASAIDNLIGASFDTMATIFNPNVDGTVGVLALQDGYLAPGGRYRIETSGDVIGIGGDVGGLSEGANAGFRRIFSTVYFRSAIKREHIATIIARDDADYAATIILTVHSADCNFFVAVGCAPLGFSGGAGSFVSLDAADITTILRAGADPNAPDTKAHYPRPLHNMIEYDGSFAAMQVLIDNGADVNGGDRYGRVPLSFVGARGADPVGEQIRFLIINNNANRLARDDFGNTPLHWLLVREESTASQLAVMLGGTPATGIDAIGSDAVDMTNTADTDTGASSLPFNGLFYGSTPLDAALVALESYPLRQQQKGNMLSYLIGEYPRVKCNVQCDPGTDAERVAVNSNVVGIAVDVDYFGGSNSGVATVVLGYQGTLAAVNPRSGAFTRSWDRVGYLYPLVSVVSTDPAFVLGGFEEYGRQFARRRLHTVPGRSFGNADGEGDITTVLNYIFHDNRVGSTDNVNISLTVVGIDNCKFFRPFCVEYGHDFRSESNGFLTASYVATLMALGVDPNEVSPNNQYNPLHITYNSQVAIAALVAAGARINELTRVALRLEGVDHLRYSTPLDIARRMAAPDEDGAVRVGAADAANWLAENGGRCNTYCRLGDINLVGDQAVAALSNARIAAPAGTLVVLDSHVSGNNHESSYIPVGSIVADGGGGNTQYSPGRLGADTAYFKLNGDSNILSVSRSNVGGSGIRTVAYSVWDENRERITGRATLSVSIYAAPSECSYWRHPSNNTNRCGDFTLTYNGDSAGVDGEIGANNPDPYHLWLLVNGGINVNELSPTITMHGVETSFQKTPLHVVWRMTLAQILLEGGANANLQDNLGETPLLIHTRRMAVGDQSAQVPVGVRRDPPRGFITMLINRGANVNMGNSVNQTPLHWAYDDPAIVQMLLDAGASVNATTRSNVSQINGFTPLDFANQHAAQAGASVIKTHAGRCNMFCNDGDVQMDGKTVINFRATLASRRGVADNVFITNYSGTVGMVSVNIPGGFSIYATPAANFTISGALIRFTAANIGKITAQFVISSNASNARRAATMALTITAVAECSFVRRVDGDNNRGCPGLSHTGIQPQNKNSIPDADLLLRLMAAGADPNEKTTLPGNGSALFYQMRAAIQYNRLDWLSVLLLAGANITAELDEGGEPYIHLAAERAATGIIHLLINNGANVNARRLSGDRKINGEDTPSGENRDDWSPIDTALHYKANKPPSPPAPPSNADYDAAISVLRTRGGRCFFNCESN